MNINLYTSVVKECFEHLIGLFLNTLKLLNNELDPIGKLSLSLFCFSKYYPSRYFTL